ncbi:MAG: HAD family hydrolase [Verrucomicrobia bacterium]|nr:HAD family hydrolase [Verrucomicrobiota bacterium]
MPRFATVLFDLDGTLIDHFAAIHRAHTHTMTTLGLPPPTMEQVHRAVGGGVEVAIERLVGRERLAAAIPIYREFWERTMLDGVGLMPGGRELVEALHARGVKLGVFTNKLGTSSRAICDHLGITSLLGAIVGAKDTPWLKPQPEFAAHILEKLAASPATALLVGDSPYDVQAGHNGGFPCWAVTTGTHSAEELRAAGADAIFPDLIALRTALAV